MSNIWTWKVVQTPDGSGGAFVPPDMAEELVKMGWVDNGPTKSTDAAIVFLNNLSERARILADVKLLRGRLSND